MSEAGQQKHIYWEEKKLELEVQDTYTRQRGVIPFFQFRPHSHANHWWLQVANLQTVWVSKSSDEALGKNVADI